MRHANSDIRRKLRKRLGSRMSRRIGTKTKCIKNLGSKGPWPKSKYWHRQTKSARQQLEDLVRQYEAGEINV